MSEEVFSHTQHFQQAIATTITCRSIIKYSSTLNDAQKDEVMTEIESTLAFLGTCLTANTDGIPAPEKHRDLVAVEAADQTPLETACPHPNLQALALNNLHKLYHAYLSNEPDKGIAALETRYKTVMGLLDQMQSSDDDERLLCRIRGFISAIYCMFREFAIVLSNIVESKAIEIDTEALALPLPRAHEEEKQQILRDITPLLPVYRMHLQVQAHKGMLSACARDATAFLIFLAENLGQNFNRRAELIGQLKSITSLLNELARLLAEYEQAMATISAT